MGTILNIIKLLSGKDQRSIAAVDDVVHQVIENPQRFSELFQLLYHDDSVLRMRAADAIEKISRNHPNYLHTYKQPLLNEIANIDQQEVRWHLAQIFPRLILTAREKKKVVDLLLNQFLADKSKIVKTFTMQALAEFANDDAEQRKKILPILKTLTKTGSPAMQSRGKKLLKRLQENPGKS